MFLKVLLKTLVDNFSVCISLHSSFHSSNSPAHLKKISGCIVCITNFVWKNYLVLLFALEKLFCITFCPQCLICLTQFIHDMYNHKCIWYGINYYIAVLILSSIAIMLKNFRKFIKNVTISFCSVRPDFYLYDESP